MVPDCWPGLPKTGSTGVVLYFVVIILFKAQMNAAPHFGGDPHPQSEEWHSSLGARIGRRVCERADEPLSPELIRMQTLPLRQSGAHIQVKSAIFPWAMIYFPLKLAGPVSFLFLLSHTILK